ncbi:MAG TPA: hypothetical protein ACFYD4_12365 [Candidatus Wunengus sp. YC61]|uniref:hypothetical protein n=1 Tax=Candidatus Wunengus sp. YC61 TaxID=3367698 RepID=UPI004027C35C
MRPKVLAKSGDIKLLFDERKQRWKMTGGEWGEHYLNASGCYNERVAAHWQGYCANNGVKVAPYPNRLGRDGIYG